MPGGVIAGMLVPWPSTFAPFSAGLGGLLGFPSLVDRVTLRGMAGRVRVREISDDEGNRLKRVVRRGAGRW